VKFPKTCARETGGKMQAQDTVAMKPIYGFLEIETKPFFKGHSIGYKSRLITKDKNGLVISKKAWEPPLIWVEKQGRFMRLSTYFLINTVTVSAYGILLLIQKDFSGVMFFLSAVMHFIAFRAFKDLELNEKNGVK